ncbi:MAG: hypothetical protein HZA50_10525 [Planctomycetes bacterium]|nr:hypothetical protein [Planctomycetota bacterium]
MNNRIQVIWENGPVEGAIEVANGRLASAGIANGQGKAWEQSFCASSAGEVRLGLEFDEVRVAQGARATRVTLNTKCNPFTFFLRDVSREFPIFIPEYGVVVTSPDDMRNYAEIADSIRGKGIVSQLAAIDNEPEESYENACRENRDLVCPTWLGLGRDMRIFEVNYQSKIGYWGYVQPRYHSTLQNVPETQDKSYALYFVIGPGASCRRRITRRLEEGVLPILRSTQSEDEIEYRLTAFATLETRTLSEENLRGSEWAACYPNTGDNMLSAEEKEKIRDLLDREMRGREEETVCRIRIEAVNTGRVPRYAWFRGLRASTDGVWRPMASNYDGGRGFTQFSSGRIFGIHLLNGKSAPDLEMAVLVRPSEKAVYDILIPHQPLAQDRAEKLARQDFDLHLDACRRFWRDRLKKAAAISIPEPAVDERIKAGLLHCDLVALGKEPDGSGLATVGWYSPIGSESSPIIQFFDSIGWHGLAERSLNFFLDRQRDDGFIQNYGGYQLETGPALWSMGEHYRYTRDLEWVRRIQPKLLKACDYLFAWRQRNKKPELRGQGYGLLDGKVADPEDFFHSFMLNGLSYLGIKRVAEMLSQIDPDRSKQLAAEAEEFRKDIRTAFQESIGRSPAIPLSDGTWCPSVPPWTEYPGSLALFADGGDWFTHGAFGARDSLIGALYLVISEVLDPREPATDILLKSHQQLFTVKNAGLSQPYYCRHDYIHLARGEVKPFLKTYYNQFTSLQDRQTYTFWEVYFGASQHKTHEEGWFLMQTRWMLLMEEGMTLHALRGIPRAWMGDGKRLSFDGLRTYFGPVSLEVRSRVGDGVIEARWTFAEDRRPDRLILRLPHPDSLRATSASGDLYDPDTESIIVNSPGREGKIVARF